jgi:hypothetical protein
MLTFDQLDSLSNPILDLYERYIQSVLNDIARRLAKMDMTSTAAWQMQRLVESGRLYETALDELTRLTGRSEPELRRLFDHAGVRAMRFDDAIYKAAGLNPLPLNLSPAMKQVLAAGLRKTQGLLRNMTLTMAVTGQNAFIDAADLAYMQVIHGAMDYNSAIRQAVKDVAAKGLTTISFAGRQEQLDVAVRRAVLTGVSQTTGQLQMIRADEMGAEYLAVSAHIGARNTGEGHQNHESWQGRVYKRVGSDTQYPNFAETTGFGLVDGLLGINCRHVYYAWYPGISPPPDDPTIYANTPLTYNGKEIDTYQATQIQRGIERKIRYWKRQAGALEAAGMDNTEERLKIGHYQAEMRDFIQQINAQSEKDGVRWLRQSEREQVAGNNIRGIKPPERKTVGFSFLNGETNLHTTAEARELGESSEGWEKNERIFRQDYLSKYNLIDDVERTLGYWGGPEPSFNANLIGKRKDIIKMSEAWGKNYNQQAVALLLPNKNAGGGKLIWDFGRELSDTEWDKFFTVFDDIQAHLKDQFPDYFGVTVKGFQKVEYWYENEQQRRNVQTVMEDVFKELQLPIEFKGQREFEFILLMMGKDY